MRAGPVPGQTDARAEEALKARGWDGWWWWEAVVAVRVLRPVESEHLVRACQKESKTRCVMELPPNPGGDKGFFSEGVDAALGKRKSSMTSLDSAKAQKLESVASLRAMALRALPETVHVDSQQWSTIVRMDREHGGSFPGVETGRPAPVQPRYSESPSDVLPRWPYPWATYPSAPLSYPYSSPIGDDEYQFKPRYPTEVTYAEPSPYQLTSATYSLADMLQLVPDGTQRYNNLHRRFGGSYSPPVHSPSTSPSTFFLRDWFR